MLDNILKLSEDIVVENENSNPINPVNQPAATQPPPIPPIQQQPVQPQTTTPEVHDTGTKTIVTVLVLLFAYPIGIILMWFWVKWPKLVKILITLPIILAFVGIIAAILLASIDPNKQLGKAQDMGNTSVATQFNASLQQYYNLHQALPWTANPPCADKPTGNENIAALSPCVNLIIKDGILKPGFLTAATTLSNLYVSDNSTANNVNVSTCFLPSVQSSADKFTSNGQACNSSSCYYCSFVNFSK